MREILTIGTIKHSVSQTHIVSEMVKAFLPQIILGEIQREPSHGYQVIQQIRKKYGVYLGPSTIYPMLRQLSIQDLVTSEWDLTHERPRKTYKITSKGQIYLTQSTTTISCFVKGEVACLRTS